MLSVGLTKDNFLELTGLMFEEVSQHLFSVESGSSFYNASAKRAVELDARIWCIDVYYEEGKYGRVHSGWKAAMTVDLSTLCCHPETEGQFADVLLHVITITDIPSGGRKLARVERVEALVKKTSIGRPRSEVKKIFPETMTYLELMALGEP